MSRLHIVEKSAGSARPPAPRRLAVLFHVYDRHTPHGRSRPFRLRPDDLEELLRAVERIEARR